jgi:RNA polymerase sigma factor (sigma-70 family)
LRAFRRAGGRPQPDQLEDLVQESYCRLLEKDSRILRRCRGAKEVSVGAYLSRVAESVAIDHLRASGAAKRGGGRIESLESLMLMEGERSCPVTEPRVVEGLIGREGVERFLACCRRIAGRRKDRNVRIMRLALLEGLTSREISQRIGNLISPTGIDTLVHRARRRLVEEGILVPRRRPVRAV